MDSDDPIVGNSEVKKLEDRVRELERMLGRNDEPLEFPNKILTLSTGATPFCYI